VREYLQRGGYAIWAKINKRRYKSFEKKRKKERKEKEGKGMCRSLTPYYNGRLPDISI